MNRHRIFLTICTILASVVGAMAQEPARPVPPVPPVAPAMPAPPAAFHWLDNDIDVTKAKIDAAREKIDAAREKIDALRFKFDAGEFNFEALGNAEIALRAQMDGKFGPFAFAPQAALEKLTRREGGDRSYERGQRALDGRRWDEALQVFTAVANAGGSRADGALYWKAYALLRLGRRDDAIAAIAELRKSYTSSRWLDDAKPLELEARLASGQKLSPEAENDEDLKLMAINGLVQSDPDRAVPLLENLLKTSSSPKLKERALFVLAQSNSARGKQLLEQVARGGAGNPDLQLKAIGYISSASRRTDYRQLLWDIYSGAGDDQVKRAVLNGLMASGDKDHLLQIAKNEKSTPVRLAAISMLGASGLQPELFQIYQTETSADVKQQLLSSMVVDRLAEVAKTEKDAKLRRTAIQLLGSMKSSGANDALVSLYAAETDAVAKRSIVQGMRSQQNAKALVDLARKENDPSLKREIVSQLSHMNSKEATDYLMELLK